MSLPSEYFLLDCKGILELVAQGRLNLRSHNQSPSSRSRYRHRQGGFSALLADGYRVALTGRRRASGADCGGADRQAPRLWLFLPIDDPESVRTLFARSREVSAGLDLLFNNAGTMFRLCRLRT